MPLEGLKGFCAEPFLVKKEIIRKSAVYRYFPSAQAPPPYTLPTLFLSKDLAWYHKGSLYADTRIFDWSYEYRAPHSPDRQFFSCHDLITTFKIRVECRESNQAWHLVGPVDEFFWTRENSVASMHQKYAAILRSVHLRDATYILW